MSNQKQHVFIIGSKGIPANYGGFETFVDKLTQNQVDKNIKYHVACLSNENREYTHNRARCFCVKTPKIGPARAVYYDITALKRSIRYCRKHNIKGADFYILACRIGPFIRHYKRKIKALGGNLYVNPDGHEWLRAKWCKPIKQYWKKSEQLMVKNADLLVCDSKNIEKYIQTEYRKYNPNTTFIAYGADTCSSGLSDDDEKYTKWLREKELRDRNYYLVVGRFVPENNFETMIREFMKSKTKKDFALITNVNDSFLRKLEERTGFRKDKRIKFVGTVYDQELLKKIRENAYGYFHGHEVGGTNPSLLEALGSTELNLLLDVGFNKEVAEDAALYWNKEDKNLANLIDKADQMTEDDRNAFGENAKKRISESYSWKKIVEEYEKLFLE